MFENSVIPLRCFVDMFEALDTAKLPLKKTILQCFEIFLEHPERNRVCLLLFTTIIFEVILSLNRSNL